MGVKDRLEVIAIACNEVGQTIEGRQSVKRQEIAPSTVRDPFRSWVPHLHLSDGTARKKEAPFLTIDEPFFLENLDGYQEREQQLMTLEQAAADIGVQRERNVLVDVLNPFSDSS